MVNVWSPEVKSNSFSILIILVDYLVGVARIPTRPDTIQKLSDTIPKKTISRATQYLPDTRKNYVDIIHPITEKTKFDTSDTRKMITRATTII